MREGTFRREAPDDDALDDLALLACRQQECFAVLGLWLIELVTALDVSLRDEPLV